MPESKKESYKDIARQLIEEKPGRNMNVIYGGGRDFLGATIPQEEKVAFKGGAETTCVRKDKQNLVDKYLNQFEADMNVSYVKNTGEMLNLNHDEVDQVLGLFANNHLPYESLRYEGPEGQPSLTEMTRSAIRVLNNKKNRNGFLLMVEGGKIDHAHHQNHARLALEEMVEFERSIQAAVAMTSDDTLIIVTADHAHSMIFNGYPTRGNDILGVITKDKSQPFETLVYATGPGIYMHTTSNDTNSSFIPLMNFTSEERHEPTYMHSSLVGMSDATHSGEDVGVYATGPGSNLVQGVFEQSYIPYIVSYAGCIGPLSNQNPACRGEKIVKSSGRKMSPGTVLLVSLVCISVVVFLVV